MTESKEKANFVSFLSYRKILILLCVKLKSYYLHLVSLPQGKKNNTTLLNRIFTALFIVSGFKECSQTFNLTLPLFSAGCVLLETCPAALQYIQMQNAVKLDRDNELED